MITFGKDKKATQECRIGYRTISNFRKHHHNCSFLELAHTTFGSLKITFLEKLGENQSNSLHCAEIKFTKTLMNL